MIADLVIRFCLWLARNRTPRVIMSRDGKRLYLTRYFLTRHSYKTEGMGQIENAPGWGLYLHCFLRGDDGEALHNHPWKWAISLVLKGGYSEERYDIGRFISGHIQRRIVKPWRLNFLTDLDFHRVDLLNDRPCWTLFLVGPISQSWGFLDRKTWTLIPWKKFLGIQ